MERLDLYGNPIDIPQENLFLYAGILVLATIVPLVFAWLTYNKRMKAEKEKELSLNNEPERNNQENPVA